MPGGSRATDTPAPLRASSAPIFGTENSSPNRAALLWLTPLKVPCCYASNVDSGFVSLISETVLLITVALPILDRGRRMGSQAQPRSARERARASRAAR